MELNTSAGDLGFAWLFVLLPAILLLNDAFHFLPEDTPYT